MKRAWRALLLGLQFGIGVATACLAQDATEPAAAQPQRVGLHDPLDGKFDLSDMLLHAHGFVPVPMVVTEPALGGFGGGVAVVFLKKNPPIDMDGKLIPVAPDITALAGLYTANDSWLGGGGRAASLVDLRLRYRIASGYCNINADFYDTLPTGEERAFQFNVRTTPVFVSLLRGLKDPRYVLGGQYTFAHTNLRLVNGGDLPSIVTQDDLESTISALGVVGEFDSRDNVFTPDHGVKVHTHFDWSDDWLGSDYRYGKLKGYVHWYQQLVRRVDGRGWVSGLRVDAQQAFSDPPFYLLPYIDMRGVPAARYQGRTNLLVETEQRIDFAGRWSSVVFGGLGKAFDDADDFDDATLVYGYGAGVRYLLARQFRLRTGLDVARGPEKWAYYIIFGSAWVE